MKKVNIVNVLKTNHSALVANVPDRKLAAIVQAIGATISASLVGAVGEKFVFVGVGSFVVKQKEVEKDGVKSTVSRIAFKPAEPQVRGGGKNKGKGKKKKNKGDVPSEE